MELCIYRRRISAKWVKTAKFWNPNSNDGARKIIRHVCFLAPTAVYTDMMSGFKQIIHHDIEKKPRNTSFCFYGR